MLLLGSGGLSIGQAGEFDYSGSQALKALKELGIYSILINPNIATVQTSENMADKVYFLPITPEYVEQVIREERPNGVLLQFGGQTALNCGVALDRRGVFQRYGVRVLGTPVASIVATEDREIFNQRLAEIGESTAPSRAASTLDDALRAGAEIGYPVIVRAAFALGGLGSGFASTDAELLAICSKAFAVSPQVLIEKSLKGWKEVEYELVRDRVGNCIAVCNMENFDPLGVHTGESIVIAPSQTLTNAEYFMLRRVGLDVAAHFGIVGECNIQFALDPHSLTYYIIEVNARLSRSSALASKATGYPLAFVAANLAVGALLPSLKNTVTKRTSACFEPSLDYCVVKVPRWEMAKFPRVDRRLGTAMKSVGEVMAIGRDFTEAFQKAIRMIDADGFVPLRQALPRDLHEGLQHPTDERVLLLATGFSQGLTVEEACRLTSIDRWFLERLWGVIDFAEYQLRPYAGDPAEAMPALVLQQAKQKGFSDRIIARYAETTEIAIRAVRLAHGITPRVNHIDTVAAEFPAQNNYLYLTYHGAPQEPSSEKQSAEEKSFAAEKVLVMGAGAYSIGTSVEFDWSAIAALRELRSLGMSTIMVNYNPETVSTDYDECDKLYFEAINFETIMDISRLETPSGLVVSCGGQLPNNIVMPLYRQGLPLLGTDPEMIDAAENRYKFSRLCDSLGLAQPAWKEADSLDSCQAFCQTVGFPCMLRPSYVISGAAMAVCHTPEQVADTLQGASLISKEYPVVISKFVEGAKEIEYDGVAANGCVLLHAISEHVENAGVHSGDATLICPPADLDAVTIVKVEEAAKAIAKALAVTGPFNIQFIAKDDHILIIECNVRASRSFPFVSKVYRTNLARASIRVLFPDLPYAEEMLQSPLYGDVSLANPAQPPPFYGVKVPQFSFSRLPGADPILGVAMQSTGEVACFGASHHLAFNKAMLAAGHPQPPRGSAVLISIGSYAHKTEFTPLVHLLVGLGYKIFATPGTADFYREQGVTSVHLVPLIEEAAHESSQSVRQVLSSGKIALVINVPSANLRYRPFSYHSPGYKMRRWAVDHAVPLITDIKSAKMFVRGLQIASEPLLLTPCDSLSARALVRLPGFIDVHVHFREPGQTHKEDWSTGTAAALAGGFTAVCAMPNTLPPIHSAENLQLAERLASASARCDYALFVQGTATNHADAALLAHAEQVAGVKLYLNQTFNNALGCSGEVPASTADVGMWRMHLAAWPQATPIVVHAEGRTLAALLFLVVLHQRPVHVAHVALRDEIELVVASKKQGLPVTCEVAPHHLFLTRASAQAALPGPGGRVEVRPRLGTQDDVDALWEHMDYIDVFATDHAPHLPEEKDADPPASAPPGFPGLETAVPLLLTAVNQRRLTLAQLEDRLVHNPRRIFRLPAQPDTFVELDLSHEWTIPEETSYCRAKWTPFAGMQVKGQVARVILRGQIAYDRFDGITAAPGFGRNLLTESTSTSPPNAVTASSSSSSFSSSMAVTASLSSSSFIGASKQPSHASAKPASRPLEQVPTRRDTFSTENLSHRPTQHRRLTPLKVQSDFPNSAIPSVERHSGAAFPKHVFSIAQFDRQQVSTLLRLAHELRVMTKRMGSLDLCRGQILATAFFEPSTRTSSSFQTAMLRLGGSVIHVDSHSSSRMKGESLYDTFRTLASYVDIIAVRTSETGEAVASAARGINIPIINGGDGIGEHPTQALLDVFTIREELGTCNGLTVAILGDLKHGRTVHSLVKCLALFDVRKLVYISDPSLAMPHDCMAALPPRIEQVQLTCLETAFLEHQPDVLYVTRVQKERFAEEEDYVRVASKYKITSHSLRHAKENMIILHPLPRVDEIDLEIDHDPRACYFRQMENGVYVRMALLATMLERA